MRIDRDAAKENRNVRKHGLDFSFAELVFSDPLALTVYDRFEGGEHRWHIFASVANKLLLIVHTYPDPDDDDWVRVIGLREATLQERKRYEEGNFD
jgi:uncharacterized DUF497 family protein